MRKEPLRFTAADVHTPLYFDFVKIKLRSAAEYHGAFWSHNLAKFLGWAAELIIVYLMIHRFQDVFTWSAYEVLLLYAVDATAYALSGFFMFGAFINLQRHIQDGTFDLVLVKPLNPFAYFCCNNMLFGYIGNLVATVLTMVFCFIQLNIVASFTNIMFLLAVLAGGALIHCGIFMISSIPSFWLIQSREVTSFFHTVKSFVRYPISIYDRWIHVLLTFIFPVAFINFFPVQFFLQKNDLLGFSPVLVYLTPAIGAGFFILGYAFFFLGIRNYKSTGS